ncbi:MAG: TlpA disulfide reductase family protein, partial [Anaerolineaceae bacterium]|nr:TlpA disulfide reductase family protein [Anaerolineaceae bacterium]
TQKSSKLMVLGINASESEWLVRQYVKDLGITFPILLDPDGEALALYLVRGFPTTLFIDADGVLQAQHIGVLNEDLMSGYLKLIGVVQ